MEWPLEDTSETSHSNPCKVISCVVSTPDLAGIFIYIIECIQRFSIARFSVIETNGCKKYSAGEMHIKSTVNSVPVSGELFVQIILRSFSFQLQL